MILSWYLAFIDAIAYENTFYNANEIIYAQKSFANKGRKS